MSTFKARYRMDTKSLLTKSTKEFFELVNELGGDVDIAVSGFSLANKVKLNSGEVFNIGTAQGYKKLLQAFNDLYDLNLDVNNCTKMGTTINVRFSEHPTQLIKETEQEKDKDGTTNEQKASTETIQARDEEVSDEGSEREEIQEEPEITPEQEVQIQEREAELLEEEEEIVEIGSTDEPDWKRISTPTFGKKKLVVLAETFGITLDSSMKYKDMVEDFKTQYKEKS